MTDLEKLAALSDAATPGVWRTTSVMLGHAGDVFVATAKRIPDCDHVARFYAPKPSKAPLCDLQSRQMTNEATATIEANAALITTLVNAYRSGDLVPRAVLDEAVGVIKNMKGRLQHADRVIVHAQGTKSPDRTDAVAQAAAFLAKHGGGDAPTD